MRYAQVRRLSEREIEQLHASVEQSILNKMNPPAPMTPKSLEIAEMFEKSQLAEKVHSYQIGVRDGVTQAVDSALKQMGFYK